MSSEKKFKIIPTCPGNSPLYYQEILLSNNESNSQLSPEREVSRPRGCSSGADWAMTAGEKCTLHILHPETFPPGGADAVSEHTQLSSGWKLQQNP